ncbi:MAG: C-3',4' desaturase CrtD, partial [Cyanobium sp.]
SSPLDPGCEVNLGDGSAPVRLWRDPERWQAERRSQFPGSERFWQLCAALHRANWTFACKDPVLPPRHPWDLAQLLGALGAANLASGFLVGASMANLLHLSGAGGDPRLRRFLDLQLKLYSQEPADRTAALYGATVLTMAQAPLGLFHLEGSMQALATGLEQGLNQAGGQLRTRHRVTSLQRERDGSGGGGGPWRIEGVGPGDRPFVMRCRDVVVTLPPQTLASLLGEQLPQGYGRRLSQLNEPSGALVLYGAVARRDLPPECPSHLQLAWDDPGALFVSVSREGDGRAPAGAATVIASVFTEARPWFGLSKEAYDARKASVRAGMERGLRALLQLPEQPWLHCETATPRGFERWTGRPFGYVGGLGQHPSRFGPFGLASRTPVPGLWLCGDSIYPGEGTAGVSLSALMASRQLLAARGLTLDLA